MKRTALFIIVSVLLLVDCADGGFGWRDSYRSNSQSSPKTYPGTNGNYAGPSRENVSNDAAIVKPEARTNNRSLGISAWGIIGMIVGLIVLATIGYYAFVLYPYLCKKQRSYDMIELTDVV